MNIDAPRDIPSLRALWKQAFGDGDAFLDGFFTLGFSEDRCRCAYEDGQLTAAAYWFAVSQGERKLAYVYAVATDMAFRGRGICHRLMEHIHDLLRQQGFDGAILVPGSKALFRLYETMGYRPFGGMDTLECLPGQGKAVLRQIGKEDYARLRRQYIPQDGVVQEGPMLDVLAAQARFFEGDGLVLCASITEAQAVIPEYLGDRAQLSSVVAALGLQQATVRVPGKADLAMYLPLNETGQKSPAYFGLALD